MHILMKNVNGINMPLDEADLAQREADASMMAVPPPLPAITAAQLRLAMLGLGMTGAQVEAAVDAMHGTDMEREAARIQWEYATTYRRDHPLVVAIGAALGLTKEQIDAAWQGAAFL